MLRDHFRKFLPHPDHLKRHRFLRVFGPVLRSPNLWHLNRHSVAGGVAAGLFTGLLPPPFQVISAAFAAILLRVNLPVAVFTTFYTNPLTFVPLYLLGYKIGGLVTGGGPNHPNFAEFDWRLHAWGDLLPEFFRWLGSLGETLLVGVALEGALFALAGYFLVQFGWRLHVLHQWRRRREKRLSRQDAKGAKKIE